MVLNYSSLVERFCCIAYAFCKSVFSTFCLCGFIDFLDPEGWSQKATLVVLLVVISSLKILKALLIRNGAQRNFADARIRADIPHRSTVSDFPLIF